jgi:thiosulfate/3-mercaptopyruvate sulfurtransferase
MSALISTEDLANKLGKPNVKVLDASWHMPSENRKAFVEYKESHIPGALFFDIDLVSDRTSPYPHMLPSSEFFAESVIAMGISNQDEIIVYDSNGIFSAPRLWWMFRVFGHDNIKILNGGLLKWKAEKRKLTKDTEIVGKGEFRTKLQPSLVRSLAEVKDNISSRAEQLIDARSNGRFKGIEPEPRPGLPSGSIEGSKNIFFKDCLMLPYNTLKSKNELKILFNHENIDITQPIITSCGSGVTACILALALYELGNINVAIYDGAWTEWANEIN